MGSKKTCFKSKKPTSQSSPNKKTFVQKVFPCFAVSNINYDEAVYDFFGPEYTEYEYVIENLAIRPAPKQLLDNVKIRPRQRKQKSPKKPVKAVVAQTESLPVVDSEPVIVEKDTIIPMDVPVCGPCNPKSPDYNPCHSKMPANLRPCKTCRTFTVIKDDQALDEETVLQILEKTKDNLYQDKKLILDDICKNNCERPPCRDWKEDKEMPNEIRKVIETLKVTKPTPNFEEVKKFLRKNFSFSSVDKMTSCDIKEDFMNEAVAMTVISDTKKLGKKEKPIPPAQLTQNTDNMAENDPVLDEKPKKKSLKWRIVISKHFKNK